MSSAYILLEYRDDFIRFLKRYGYTVVECKVKFENLVIGSVTSGAYGGPHNLRPLSVVVGSPIWVLADTQFSSYHSDLTITTPPHVIFFQNDGGNGALNHFSGSLKLTENSREGNQPGNIDYDTFIAYNFKRWI